MYRLYLYRKNIDDHQHYCELTKKESWTLLKGLDSNHRGSFLNVCSIWQNQFFLFFNPVVAERLSCSRLTSALTPGLPGTSSLPSSSTFPEDQRNGYSPEDQGPTTSPPTLDLPGTNLTPPPPFSAVWPFVTQSLSSHQSWRSNTQCPKLELVSLVGRYSSALAFGNRPRNRVWVE